MPPPFCDYGKDAEIMQALELFYQRIHGDYADTLRRNGFIIVSGLESLPTVRFRADVPQKVYNIASASNYNLRIDLARIHDTGEQTLNIISTTTNTYGTVTEMSVSTVTVQVEEYISRSRIPVRLSTTGNPPDGFYAAGASVDPSYVTVSGPRSLVAWPITTWRCLPLFRVWSVRPFPIVWSMHPAMKSTLP